jgi:hypothetical protein
LVEVRFAAETAPIARRPAGFLERRERQILGSLRQLAPDVALPANIRGLARLFDMGSAQSGSVVWNPWRKRWVTVFVEIYGKPSLLGELWYAEADAPTGPWGKAVKILSHDNYSFYNPRLHPEFTSADSPILIFEGTYTAAFADRPPPTPRYDYNQILYRLDLDDPRLQSTQGK